MRLLIEAFLLLTALWLLASCEKEGREPEQGRVLLFYMAVDEASISSDWYDKLEAVKEGARNTSADILVYSDTERTTPTLQKIVFDARGEAALEIVEQYEEEDSASPAVLQRTIARMQRMYPGRQYGLILFTHSSGWLPAGALLDPLSGEKRGSRSIGIDDNPAEGNTSRQEMELSDFSSALPDGLFDFIIFESCLTANVEVAYELRHKTPYILASSAEIVSPGFAPVYKTHLAGLIDPRKGSKESLIAFSAAYMEIAKSNQLYDHSATISVIETAHMGELAGSVREILAEADGTFTDFDGLQYFDRYKIYMSPSSPRFFDLDQYIESVADQNAYRKFCAALEKTVVYKGSTPSFLLRFNGFAISRHAGLTTYIERPEYETGRINAAWRQTAWYKATHR